MIAERLDHTQLTVTQLERAFDGFVHEYPNGKPEGAAYEASLRNFAETNEGHEAVIAFIAREMAKITWRPRMGRVFYGKPDRKGNHTEYRTANVCLRPSRNGLSFKRIQHVQKMLEVRPSCWSKVLQFTRFKVRDNNKHSGADLRRLRATCGVGGPV